MQIPPCMYIYLSSHVRSYLPTSDNTYRRIPTYSTVNPAQCLESPLSPTVEPNMAYGQKIPHIGGLWTATINTCPLCFLVDSGSHLLRGCRHRDIIKSYIECHNEAGILITKTVKQGPNDINVSTADG